MHTARVRRSVQRAVTSAVLAALLAQLALPTVVAARSTPPRSYATVTGAHGSHGEAAGHHHPGCPWREKGPCPHATAADPGGPAISACADDPAAATATKSLLLVGEPVLDFGLRPAEIPVSIGTSLQDPSTVPILLEPPPPRPARAS